MKLPRNLTGAQLIKALGQLGYHATRQAGSHVQLTCSPLPTPLPQAGEGANKSLSGPLSNEHHLTVPLHDPLRIGTLAAILADVATHHAMTKETLADKLFGK